MGDRSIAEQKYVPSNTSASNKRKRNADQGNTIT